MLTKTLSTLGAVTGLVGAGLATYGYRQLTDFRLHEVHVPGPSLRILHISDLHMIPGQQAKIDFVHSLASLKPDLVVNTGDNLSDPAAIPMVTAALTPLFDVPGVFVFGTNDYYEPNTVNPFYYLAGKRREVSHIETRWRDMRAVFVEHGWKDLTNTRDGLKINGVNVGFGGVDDPHHDLDEYPGPPLPDADFTIALLHAPEPRVLAQFAADGYDLALSGHTHGGQICWPNGQAIVTNCGISPDRASGLSTFGSMHLHVSNGLGTSKFAPIRLFCPPSATLITVGD